LFLIDFVVVVIAAAEPFSIPAVARSLTSLTASHIPPTPSTFFLSTFLTGLKSFFSIENFYFATEYPMMELFC
jgi:hypothetical protein